jgi:tRNA 2-thiocytidine biosynthesis protein TtcA
MARQPLKLLHSTIRHYGLLEPGDPVIVAVSGGADSLCLLKALGDYSLKQHLNYRLLAVHVDPGFQNWPTQRIERLFQRLGVEHEIIRADVPERIAHYGENPCYVCSRERRKQLFELARRRSIRKIALAHHLEDVNETYLLNLLYSASARTFVPRQKFFGGKVEFIRPLYAFDKPAIMKYLRSQGLKAIRTPCPYAVHGRREEIRRFLNRLYQRYPRIRQNLFSGIRNVKAEYLP